MLGDELVFHPNFEDSKILTLTLKIQKILTGRGGVVRSVDKIKPVHL